MAVKMGQRGIGGSAMALAARAQTGDRIDAIEHQNEPSQHDLRAMNAVLLSFRYDLFQ